jgi:Cu(I)/Ag(I) efflux system protein CusF
MKSATKTKETTMRKITLIFATILAVSSALLPKVTAAQSAMINGQVTKIDVSAGKITLKHGPIKKLEMEDPMTMVFRVQDLAMLKQIKVGDKVKFDADRINGQFTLTKIEKSK